MSDHPNIPSPYEFWEDRWKSGHTPWDHGRHAPPFEEFVERKNPPSGKILIPGSGSGHDVHYFASLGAEVTGLEISPSALKVANRINPHPRANYLRGDILNPSPELHGQFDWVIEHTCLCALDPANWASYAASIPRLLVAGGNFLALFYRHPHDTEGPPHRIEAEMIDALFGPNFTLQEAWVPHQSYASRAGREELRWYKSNR